jgi:hypothetical protein
MEKVDDGMFGFCHRHRDIEEIKHIDPGHVIIDYNDWSVLRGLHLNFVCFLCGEHPKIEFNMISDIDRTSMIQSKSNWVCNSCRARIREFCQ